MDSSQAAELNKKIDLELKFQKKIDKILNRMVNDYQQTYADKGQIISASNYDSQWQKTLGDQYDDVNSEFTGISSKELGIKGEKKQWLIALLAFKLLKNDRAKKSTNQISQTNQHNLSKATESAIIALSSNNMQPTNQRVAEIASESIRSSIKGRSSLIAMAETQFMANSTKHIEASALTNTKDEWLDKAYEANSLLLADSPYITDEPTPAQKEWESILSPTTRSFHAEAHGQRTQLDGFFYVHGEYLKFPGDTSMGASASNIIRCHCRARYSTK